MTETRNLELRILAMQTRLNELEKTTFFDITVVHKLAPRPSNVAAMTTLSLLHCTDYAAMSPELLVGLQELLQVVLEAPTLTFKPKVKT